MASEKIQKTLSWLDEHGITYEVHYHPPLFTIEEALAYWKDIDSTHCKNLFMRNHKGNRHYLISFECHKNLDIHSLEKMLKQGKISFASPERMDRCLGVAPGSVCAFGLINDIGIEGSADPRELFENGHRVKYFLDSDLRRAPRISFHPCDNTASVVVSNEMFMKFLALWGGEYEWLDIPGRDNALKNRMMEAADPSQAEGLSRFFKTGKGQYGEGDRFLGIKVPVTRSIVKDCWRGLSMEDIEGCICSEYHELRLAALLSLVEIFRHSKKDRARQKECIDFYLSHLQYVNNWDLVDLSCYPLLGEWLMDKDRGLLYDLARDGKTIWERRIGIVSTMTFVRAGQLDDTYSIAEIFLGPSGTVHSGQEQPLHDLLQKAVGWLLREAGKRDSLRLENWLEHNAPGMPRVMLRYAIEKFPPEKRASFLAAGK